MRLVDVLASSRTNTLTHTKRVVRPDTQWSAWRAWILKPLPSISRERNASDWPHWRKGLQVPGPKKKVLPASLDVWQASPRSACHWYDFRYTACDSDEVVIDLRPCPPHTYLDAADCSSRFNNGIVLPPLREYWHPTSSTLGRLESKWQGAGAWAVPQQHKKLHYYGWHVKVYNCRLGRGPSRSTTKCEAYCNCATQTRCVSESPVSRIHVNGNRLHSRSDDLSVTTSIGVRGVVSCLEFCYCHIAYYRFQSEE